MKSPYEQQLTNVLNGLRIDPEQRQITVVADGSRTDYQPETLHSTLAGLLYRHFYCASESAVLTSATSAPPTDDSFVSELSSHNQSIEQFDRGWSVEAVDTGGIAYAAKGNHRRMMSAGEFVYDMPKRGPVQAGDAVRLLMHHEHRNAQSGFYYVFGQTPGDDSIVLQSRLYFHITPEGSARLITWVTQTLNAYKIPFQFKCLNHPDLYGRPDPAVLYLQKPSVNIVLELLGDALPALSPYLHPSIPLFTRVIAPGIGFAESPPNPSESFGTSRCGLIAKGIAKAVNNRQAVSMYEESVRAIFTQIGLALEHPYLNPQSHYPYVFPDFTVN